MLGASTALEVRARNTWPGWRFPKRRQKLGLARAAGCSPPTVTTKTGWAALAGGSTPSPTCCSLGSGHQLRASPAGCCTVVTPQCVHVWTPDDRARPGRSSCRPPRPLPQEGKPKAKKINNKKLQRIVTIRMLRSSSLAAAGTRAWRLCRRGLLSSTAVVPPSCGSAGSSCGSGDRKRFYVLPMFPYPSGLFCLLGWRTNAMTDLACMLKAQMRTFICIHTVLDDFKRGGWRGWHSGRQAAHGPRPGVHHQRLRG